MKNGHKKDNSTKLGARATGRRIETLNDYFSALAGPEWHRTSVLEWPPDVFCLVAGLLQRTGAYVRVVQEWPPKGWRPPNRGGARRGTAAWANEMARRGESWWAYANAAVERRLISTFRFVPRYWGTPRMDGRIMDSWRVVKAHANTPISTLIACRSKNRHKKLWAAVFELLAAADEACAGIGITTRSKFLQQRRGAIDYFLFAAREGVFSRMNSGGSATLSPKIPAYLGTVMPKMHTPQSGITLRSLTHNLAYVRPTEVCVNFRATFSGAGFIERAAPAHSINVLFIPWPSDVRPCEFTPVTCKKQSICERYSFFTYNGSKPSLSRRKQIIRNMLARAESIVGRVDGVLMPELALNDGEFAQIASVVQKENPSTFLIAGVGRPSSAGFGMNKAVFSPSRFGASFEQAKHHRWQLNGAQIDSYGLGANLDPTKLWWEHIPIENRGMTLAAVSGRVTLAMLICEDLARQDPIAEVIRTIGPNLLVALLMDGPQLSGRWPAHYATVFADDPGSSVLTVTSIGMSKLCRPKGVPARRVVGLWKDRFDGFREIELPEGADALVLTLTLVDDTEWTADGRSDSGQSTYLKLNGVHAIFPDERRRAKSR